MRRQLTNLLITALLMSPAQIFAQQENGEAVSPEPVSARGLAERYIGEEDWVSATPHCTNWLAITERRVEKTSENLIDPLLCVGISALSTKDYASAIEHYSRAIKITEKHRGVFSGDLVAPLEGLGTALMKLDKHEQATSVLIRAKDVTHRNQGIFNLQQASIINRLTIAYLHLDEISDANREQRFMLHSAEDNFGDTPRLAPALRRMASWQRLLGRPDMARGQYRRAAAILERAYGPNDVRIAGPLRDLADSYFDGPREGRILSGEGTRALTKVVNIYQNQEFVDVQDLAQSWIDLGDWYIRSGRRSRAVSAYQEGWSALEGNEEMQAQMFSEPVEIELAAVPQIIGKRAMRNFPAGVVEIEYEFTVTASGHIRDIRVVRDEIGSKVLASKFRSNLATARFRPRIDNGEAVSTEGVKKIIRFEFKNDAVPIQNSDTVSVSEDATQSEELPEDGSSPLPQEAPGNPSTDEQ